MPLTMMNAGETNTIKKIGGKEETRRFLENIGGNLIVNVKDSRVAIGKDMASKIMV